MFNEFEVLRVKRNVQMYNAYLEINSISENYTYKSIITSHIKILNVEKFGYVISSRSLTSVRSTRLDDPSTGVSSRAERRSKRVCLADFNFAKGRFCEISPVPRGGGGRKSARVGSLRHPETPRRPEPSIKSFDGCSGDWLDRGGQQWQRVPSARGFLRPFPAFSRD